jgi:hypothetical protein
MALYYSLCRKRMTATLRKTRKPGISTRNRAIQTRIWMEPANRRFLKIYPGIIERGDLFELFFDRGGHL